METAAAAVSKGGKKPAVRKPVVTKVDQLYPDSSGHTVTVKVVSAELIPAARPRRGRVAECLVGDETGAIFFTARDKQVNLLKPGTTVILRKARVDMLEVRGSMRLVVDKFGTVEVTEPANFTVKVDNNLSLVEYELVDVRCE